MQRSSARRERAVGAVSISILSMNASAVGDRGKDRPSAPVIRLGRRENFLPAGE
jgi:hypothetical protein